MCLLTCVKISLQRLSNKVVSLNLAPFSEMVENHCFRLRENKSFTQEGQLESMEASEDRRTICDRLRTWSTRTLLKCFPYRETRHKL